MVVRSGAVHAVPCRLGAPQDPTPFPASPHQTVHAILPHTAFRGRSPRRSRRCRCPGHGPSQVMHPKDSEAGLTVACFPPSGSPRLVAQPPLHPLTHVGVDLRELPSRVADPKVGTPAPQHHVHFRHDRGERFRQATLRRRDRCDPIPDRLPRPTTRPGLQIPGPRPPPRVHLPNGGTPESRSRAARPEHQPRGSCSAAAPGPGGRGSTRPAAAPRRPRLSYGTGSPAHPRT